MVCDVSVSHKLWQVKKELITRLTYYSINFRSKSFEHMRMFSIL